MPLLLLVTAYCCFQAYNNYSKIQDVEKDLAELQQREHEVDKKIKADIELEDRRLRGNLRNNLILATVTFFFSMILTTAKPTKPDPTPTPTPTPTPSPTSSVSCESYRGYDKNLRLFNENLVAVLLPAPGYKWVNGESNNIRGTSDDLLVEWESGQQHPDCPNIRSGETDKIWIPDNGYKFVTQNAQYDIRVTKE